MPSGATARKLSTNHGTVENRISYPATKDRVPHPSRSLRRVGCHCSSPEALPRNFCLSHPSQKTRRVGHPMLCGRARNTRLPFDLSLVFITLGEPQAHGDTAEAVPFLQRLFPKKKWKPLCLREMRAVWRKRGEASAAGDLNGDAFSSKNQGVDGPCTGAEHGQTDGEHSNQNVTLVMCWT